MLHALSAPEPVNPNPTYLENAAIVPCNPRAFASCSGDAPNTGTATLARTIELSGKRKGGRRAVKPSSPEGKVTLGWGELQSTLTIETGQLVVVGLLMKELVSRHLLSPVDSYIAVILLR